MSVRPSFIRRVTGLAPDYVLWAFWISWACAVLIGALGLWESFS